MVQQTYLVKHPLIEHKLSMLRDQATNRLLFRVLMKEITRMMIMPATQKLPLKKRGIVTPVAPSIGHELAEEIVVVPIIRAGLGMLEAFMEAIPTARVGHLGLARDEKTLQAKQYMSRLPHISVKTQVFILDPMLATGGTLTKAIDLIEKKGVTSITYIGLVGSQKGIDLIEKNHPRVKIFLASIDPELNAKGFLVPGLGDAGDRLFGESD